MHAVDFLHAQNTECVKCTSGELLTLMHDVFSSRQLYKQQGQCALFKLLCGTQD